MAGRVWPARPFRERDPLSAVVYGSRTWRAVTRDMLLGPPHYTGAAAASGTGTATVGDDITFYSEGWDGTPSTALTSGSGSWSAMYGAGTATYSADGTYAQIAATATTKSFYFYYPATPSLVAVFYLRLTSLPSATTVLAQWLSPTVQVGDLRVLTSGALHLRDATTARITTPALTVGAWYRIVVISVPGSSAGHRLRVSGPGVNVDQVTTATLAGQTDLTRFAIGVVSSATASVDVDSLSLRSQVETPPASSSDFTGTASSSGTGTATVSASLAVASGVSASGTGTATATGAAAITAAAAASGTGTATATGAPRFPVTATTSGTGTVSGTGTPAITGTAAASGTGTATASSSGYTGTAAASGTGTATAVGTPAIPAAVTSSGTGTVAGSGTPHLTVAVPATGTGTVVASTGTVTVTAPAAASGTGTATAAGAPKIAAVAGTTGVGSTTATGAPSTSWDAVATGAGTATADGTPAVTGTAIAAGDGTATAVGVASFVVYPRRRTLTDATTRARTVHDRTRVRALTGTGVGRRLDHD